MTASAAALFVSLIKAYITYSLAFIVCTWIAFVIVRMSMLLLHCVHLACRRPPHLLNKKKHQPLRHAASRERLCRSGPALSDE